MIGGSRPRGPGIHSIFFLVFVPIGGGAGGNDLFEITGETDGGGGAATVIPAHVEGGVGIRETNFSERNMLLKFITWRPVAANSRTTGGPSIMVIR